MIQYPKNEHLTLPSVEGGFGTLNILRDPPKSIETRYISKVGDTSKIATWVDDSGDRICEGINKYARGINPMVSVSYTNEGSNGGQVRFRAGNVSAQTTALNSGQAYMPYRVNREGAFRPPIVPPQELYALSRLPRVSPSYYTNPGSAQVAFNQDLKCSSNLREIRNQLLTVTANPRAIFNIETPQMQPFDVKSSIIDNKKHSTISANINSNQNNQLSSNANIGKEIQSVSYNNVSTNQNDINHQVGINYIPQRGINNNIKYNDISVPISNVQYQMTNNPIPDRGITQITYNNVSTNIGDVKHIPGLNFVPDRGIQNVQYNDITVPISNVQYKAGFNQNPTREITNVHYNNVDSNKSEIRHNRGLNLIPERGINDKLKYTNLEINKGQVRYQNGQNYIPTRQIKEDMRFYDVSSNPTQNIQPITLDQFKGNQSIFIKDVMNPACSSNIKGPENVSYIHSDIMLNKKLSNGSVNINVNKNGVDFNNNINNNNYVLPKKSQKGSFNNQGFTNINPTTYDRNIQNSCKMGNRSIYKMAAESIESRNSNNPRFINIF
jgi:hypothetical protein